MLEQIFPQISRAQFLREYLEKQWLLGQESRLEPVYSRADLLAGLAVGGKADRLKGQYHGLELAASNFTHRGWADLGRITKLIKSGGTLIANSVHLRSVPLQNFLFRLEEDLDASVHANCYWTPASSQGFNAHFDNHDVIVLQVEGSKRWLLYEMAQPRALRGLHKAYRHNCTEVRQELVLHAGESLYIPRGLVHAALAEQEESIHLTLGFLPRTVYSVLQLALEKHARESGELRASLLSLEHEGQSAIETVVRQLERIARDFNLGRILDRQPRPALQVSHAAPCPLPLHAHSRLRASPDLQWQLQPGELLVNRPEQSPVAVNPRFGAALAGLRGADTFQVSEVALVEPEERLYFCRFLELQGLAAVM